MVLIVIVLWEYSPTVACWSKQQMYGTKPIFTCDWYSVFQNLEATAPLPWDGWFLKCVSMSFVCVSTIVSLKRQFFKTHFPHWVRCIDVIKAQPMFSLVGNSVLKRIFVNKAIRQCSSVSWCCVSQGMPADSCSCNRCSVTSRVRRKRCWSFVIPVSSFSYREWEYLFLPRN